MKNQHHLLVKSHKLSHNYYKLLVKFYEIQLFLQLSQEWTRQLFKKKKNSIYAKRSRHKEIWILNISLQRLNESCLLLCIAIFGCSGTYGPDKSALKRDPGYPPVSTLWQSNLPITSLILTCGDMVLVNRRAVVPNES